jgi:hypothetical protein
MDVRSTCKEISICVSATAILLSVAVIINTLSSFFYLWAYVFVPSIFIVSGWLILDSCVVPALNEEYMKRLALKVNQKVMVFLFPLALSLAEILITYNGESIRQSINRTVFHCLTMAIHYVGIDSDNPKFDRWMFALAVFMHFISNLNYVILNELPKL